MKKFIENFKLFVKKFKATGVICGNCINCYTPTEQLQKYCDDCCMDYYSKFIDKSSTRKTK